MPFRYRLFLEDGDDVGEWVSAVPTWNVGDVMHLGAGESYRVLRVVDRDPDLGAPFDEVSEYRAFLTVEPA